MSGPDGGPESGGGEQGGHKRRPRYRGTHPRRFAERYKELGAAPDSTIHAHIRAQGRTPAGTHRPVLVAEVLEALRPALGETGADCTLGFGGHAAELLQRIGPTGRLLGLEVDEASLNAASERLRSLEPQARIAVRRSNFAGLPKFIGELLWGADDPPLTGFDFVLADLGVSSMQIDDPARGFSYKHDGPLDMRMDQRIRRTAAEWLAKLTPHELAETLRDFGDEPAAEAIAAEIVGRRARSPIRTTRELVRIVESATGFRRAPADDTRDTHPAARVFQAIRILVNDEMGALTAFLRGLPFVLKPGGRVAILTFHCGEARRAHAAFTESVRTGYYAEVSDEPIGPSAAEVHANPRSRSARLWWARASDSAKP